MKFYVTKDAISHRGVTVNKGDIIEETDRNHIGGLQSVGCQKYDEAIHGQPKAEAPKPTPEVIVEEPKPKPEPAKKEAPKKKQGRSKRQ